MSDRPSSTRMAQVVAETVDETAQPNAPRTRASLAARHDPIAAIQAALDKSHASDERARDAENRARGAEMFAHNAETRLREVEAAVNDTSRRGRPPGVNLLFFNQKLFRNFQAPQRCIIIHCTTAHVENK
jgi:hypothetical protein